MTISFPPSRFSPALTLGERAKLLARFDDRAGLPFDEDLARRELERWKNREPFGSADYFAARLRMDGIADETEFLRILGTSAEELARGMDEKPSWVKEFEVAYGAPPPASPVEKSLPESMRAVPTIAFLRAVDPLLCRLKSAVAEGARGIAEDHAGVPFDPETVAGLFVPDLAWMLHGMVMRTMVLELNVARIQGVLEGETPEERWNDFVSRLSIPAFAGELLMDYPFLARRLVGVVGRAARFAVEFLGHLARDWEEIRRRLASGADPGLLESVDSGAGDTHRGGRAVLVARFGSGFRVVYKPRSMAVEEHFQQLLKWIGEGFEVPTLRRLTVIDRGSYGWVEFVTAEACASREQVERFYLRQGAYLALLYALEATDFHFENLIAAGEHPVLIDLETLFHGRLRSSQVEQVDLRLVSDALADSVLRVGLLPHRSFGDEEQAGVDLSGIGMEEGQATPDRVLQWDGIGTDQMRAKRERVAMPGGKNRPSLGTEDVTPADYADEIVRGFTAAYRLFLENREELFAAGGPLSRLKDDEVRSVLRATRGYGLYLQEGFHPDFLRDALEYEYFLDRLWVGVEENPHLIAIIAAEREDLLEGDIPLFSTRPSSRSAWDSRGREIPGYWNDSGLDLVRRRLEGFSEEDLQRQVWFVRASLATLTLGRDQLLWPTYSLVEEAPALSRDALRPLMVEAALEVGDRLQELSLREDGDVAWVGLAFAKEQWGLVPLLEDLYAGVSGLILFLAYLERVSGRASYGELARQAFRTFRQRLSTKGATLESVGAFSGWGGVLYLLAHLHHLWGGKEPLNEAEKILERLPALIDRDTDFDVIGGLAGCIGGLLALDDQMDSPLPLRLARRCGDRLIAASTKMETGIAWFTRIQTDEPITGFSHGGAGITWALAELYRATGEDSYRRAALDGVLYEHTRFVPGKSNWIDPIDPAAPQSRSDSDAGKALSMAWCYGAPGIGLSRLRLLPEIDHPVVREELEIAVRTTLERGFGRNHCLCHGDLGNLDFIDQAARYWSDEELTAAVDQILARTLESMKRGGWVCGVPLGVEAPSLMNGLAGIGYGLLRLAAPDQVPSVLVLERPAPGEREERGRGR